MASREVTSSAVFGLPASITRADLERNPDFARLLEDLSARTLGGDAIWEPQQHNIELLKASTSKEKMRLLQMQTLYAELKEICIFHQIDSDDEQLRQLLDECGQRIAVSEAEEYLDISQHDDSDVFLFGMNPSSFSKLVNADLIHGQDVIQQVLIPEVESRLRKKCELIADYYESHKSDSTVGAALGRFGQLNVTVSTALLEADKTDAEIETVMESLCTLSIELIKSLGRTVEILGESMQTYVLAHQKDCDEVTSSYLISCCQTMIMKMKVLKYEILNNTYSNLHIEAHQRIKNHLDLRLEEINIELQKAKKRIDQYQQIGSGFSEVAEEYATLQREIQNKLWALRELQMQETSLGALEMVCIRRHLAWYMWYGTRVVVWFCVDTICAMSAWALREDWPDRGRFTEGSVNETANGKYHAEALTKSSLQKTWIQGLL